MVPQKTTRASKQPKTKSIFGFTLIELIVVITILAILGTIGFLSIGGYSSKARDSSRISDVANISKSLDVSIITVGTYPTPDNSFAVTYSGGTIWNQGTISTNVLQALRTSIAGGGLSKKPVDPLDNSEYEYSSLAFGKAYQIKAEYEGDLNQTAYELSTPSLIEEAKAAPGSPTIAYIKGNYGGLLAKTVTGSMTYILAIPSIMTSTGTTSGNKIEITTSNALSGTLLFNGKSLKNASAFNPNLTPVFSGSGKVLTTSAEITTLMTNLKNTYTNSGATDVKSNASIASLLAMDTNGLTNLGSNIVKSELGINPIAGGNEGATTCSISLPLNGGGTTCGDNISNISNLNFASLPAFTITSTLGTVVSTETCKTNTNCIYIGNGYIVSPATTHVNTGSYTHANVKSYCDSYSMLGILTGWKTYHNTGGKSNPTLASKIYMYSAGEWSVNADLAKTWYSEPEFYGRDGTDWWGAGYDLVNKTQHWTCTWCGGYTQGVEATLNTNKWERRCVYKY